MTFTYADAVIVFSVLIVIFFGILLGPTYLRREKPVRRTGFAVREHYGPPPGARRAIDHNELPDDRGWPGLDRAYEASSASAISHMIERSA
ncbi:MAG: hypothetical protein EB034_00890 [Verrucomicrobia bacterium]|jgi:hypothetical protein|nr:hypothetical protein [Verrucomicrobiota bacterium]